MILAWRMLYFISCQVKKVGTESAKGDDKSFLLTYDFLSIYTKLYYYC